MRRIFWELLGFACLVYDIVTLPLDVFGYDDTDVAKSLRFAVSTFWLCDLMLSFFFGYMENGAAEMRIFKAWLEIPVTLKMLQNTKRLCLRFLRFGGFQ